MTLGDRRWILTALVSVCVSLYNGTVLLVVVLAEYRLDIAGGGGGVRVALG